MQLLYYRHNKNNPCQIIDRRRISFNELTFMLEGSMDYYVDGNKYTLSSGDAIFIKSGSLRHRPISTAVCDYVSFNFTDEQNSGTDFPILINNIVNGEIRHLIFCADGFKEKQYENGNALTTQILLCIIDIMKVLRRRDEESRLVTKIKKYISEHLDRKITLKDIGNATFFSPVYCETVFKKETGIPIISYVTDTKIEEAKLMLLEYPMSINKISETLGFEDLNYFIRVFKKKTGLTPLRYRKQFCK